MADNGSSKGSVSSFAAKYNLAPHFIGGSHLGAAQPGKVKDFVTAHDGHTVISKVRPSVSLAMPHLSAERAC